MIKSGGTILIAGVPPSFHTSSHFTATSVSASRIAFAACAVITVLILPEILSNRKCSLLPKSGQQIRQEQDSQGSDSQELSSSAILLFDNTNAIDIGNLCRI